MYIPGIAARIYLLIAAYFTYMYSCFYVRLILFFKYLFAMFLHSSTKLQHIPGTILNVIYLLFSISDFAIYRK